MTEAAAPREVGVQNHVLALYCMLISLLFERLVAKLLGQMGEDAESGIDLHDIQGIVLGPENPRQIN